jgi:transposase
VCKRDLVDVVFPHLAAVEIKQVDRRDGRIRVVARTRDDPVSCPSGGVATGKVRGYHRRRLADRPVDGAPVVIELRLRRLACSNLDCTRQTFHEQVPGLADRYLDHADPADLSPGRAARLQEVPNCRPELKQAAEHVHAFADLLTQRRGDRLTDWIDQVRASDLQHLRSFAEGLLIDDGAVTAGLPLPYGNGLTEGVITKIIMWNLSCQATCL